MTRAQLGSIQRIDKDRYRVSVELDRVSAKRQRKSKVVRGSRETAEIELAKMKLSAGMPVEIDMTVSMFFKTVYEPSLVRLREKTRSEYIRTYERHIEPRFGDKQISTLTSLMIEEKLWEIEKAGAQRHAYAILRQIINVAYQHDFIEKNPFHKRIRLRPKVHYEPAVFTINEFADVVKAIRGENIEPIILTMLFGGLRREEACGLFWDDITEHNGSVLIKVSKGLQCVGETPVEVSTKTERSNRTVVISPPASSRLLELKAAREGEPLVPNIHGERMNPNIVAKRWRVICEEKGLKKVPMKNLRTSYATSLKQSGVDNATISELLGHTHLSTAYDHYFAVNLDAHKIIAEGFGKATAYKITSFEKAKNSRIG